MQQLNDAVQVVAVFPSEGDRQALREIFVHSNWQLRFADTLSELQESLRKTRIGVVIAHSKCADFGWKDVLAEAEKVEGNPRVIVTSRLADDHLWAEVLNLRGFDVLSMPFERVEVLRCVALAWRTWLQRSTFHSASAAQGMVGASA